KVLRDSQRGAHDGDTEPMIAAALGGAPAVLNPPMPNGESRVESLRSLMRAETREGAIAGTLPYMAPEQASGFTREIDRRSDVWALGAILYTLLAGHPPHVWGEARHEYSVLLKRAREGKVRPVRDMAAKRFIPAGLERIALKALATDPAERYPDAGGMLEDML